MDTTLTADTPSEALTTKAVSADTDAGVPGAPSTPPGRWSPESGSVLEHYGINTSELDQLLVENPSLRSFVIGYSAEAKLNAAVTSAPGVQLLGKPDDHDRTNKSDQRIAYKGFVARLEVKSLQSATVRPGEGGTLEGKFQCDASDCRDVELPDGSTLKTTCLAVGGFDLVAVNCFEFFGEWRFAFAAQSGLPRTTCTRYTESQREHLLATTAPLSTNLAAPFSWSITEVLDQLIEAGSLERLEEG